ncbi:HD domain-containing protein [Candidatus Pacearchaeota archaeon]|nr:HD domain-containing protein [Candidatus Pacearchaeota archaeon]
MLKKLEEYVKKKLTKDKTGHDFEHVKRVLNLSLRISKNYSDVDDEVLIAACLLHDISYMNGYVKNHHLVSANLSKDILLKFKFPKNKILKVQDVIVDHVAHMGKSKRVNEKLPIESRILRDADNLDALGSIGLIRMISFSLRQDIPYFNFISDKLDESFYGNVKFLLDWPKKMLTPKGGSLAKQRVKILKSFIVEMEKEFS